MLLAVHTFDVMFLSCNMFCTFLVAVHIFGLLTLHFTKCYLWLYVCIVYSIVFCQSDNTGQLKVYSDLFNSKLLMPFFKGAHSNLSFWIPLAIIQNPPQKASEKDNTPIEQQFCLTYS